MATEQFEVRNRFTNAVQFTATIECAPGATVSIKLGLAVKWAVKARANLADANLARANLAGANLARANLADADLADANLAGANLARANLARADLAGANLARANLADADLAGANLARADLADANLARADLADANLAGANLAGADWLPKIGNIHQKVFAAASAEGALNMDSWHADGYCGTTHCRAGLVVVLAGEGGRVLEGVMGTGTAAALIYKASDPNFGKVPNWNDSNEAALADMKALAEAEAAA